MPATGYKQSLYFGNETTFGSAALVNNPIGLVQSVNPTETNNLMKLKTLGGTRDYSNIVPGKFEVSGSFEYYLQDARFLRHAWSEDTATSATIDSGPKIHTGASYLHVMGSANSPDVGSFPSFTLEFADAEDDGSAAATKNLTRTYTGCRVNNLGISATVDAPVSVNCDWIGQGVTVSSSDGSAVTDSTKDPYVFYQGQVYSTSGTITAYSVIGTSSQLAEVKSFELSVANNLEPVWYISGTTNGYQSLRGLKELVPKGRDYDGSISLDFKNRQMYRRFLGNDTANQSQGTLTSYTIVLDFVRSGTIGGTKVATDDWIRVVMPETKFADINIAGAPEDIVSENLTLSIERAKLYVVDSLSSYNN